MRAVDRMNKQLAPTLMIPKNTPVTKPITKEKSKTLSPPPTESTKLLRKATHFLTKTMDPKTSEKDMDNIETLEGIKLTRD